MGYYSQSEEKGISLAFNNIGVLYEKGYGFKQDYSKAIEHYFQSAEKGNSLALNNIAFH